MLKILELEIISTKLGYEFEGTFIDEKCVGTFSKKPNKSLKLPKWQSVGNQVVDIPLTESIKEEIENQIKIFPNIKNSIINKITGYVSYSIYSTASTNISYEGVEYKPSLKIKTRDHEIIWQWRITCKGATVESCIIEPLSISIISDCRFVVTPESKEWNLCEERIRKIFPENPGNLVAIELLEDVCKTYLLLAPY